jgi:hypothetical protein
MRPLTRIYTDKGYDKSGLVLDVKPCKSMHFTPHALRSALFNVTPLTLHHSRFTFHGSYPSHFTIHASRPHPYPSRFTAITLTSSRRCFQESPYMLQQVPPAGRSCPASRGYGDEKRQAVCAASRRAWLCRTPGLPCTLQPP